MKALTLPIVSSLFLAALSSAQTITLSSLPYRELNPEAASDFKPEHYHFDCRALMLYDLQTKPHSSDKAIEIASYVLLTPAGGALMSAALMKTRAGSFGALLYPKASPEAKLFHFINYLHAKVGKPVVTIENFLDGNPIPLTNLNRMSQKSQNDLDTYQAQYKKGVERFADDFGLELTQNYFGMFRKYHVFSDEQIYQYLYLATYQLNYNYGPGMLCEFKNNPGKMAQYHIGNARYHVASFKKAKEMIIQEAIMLATENESLARALSAGSLPEPPHNPFLGDWLTWFRNFGPRFRLSFNDLR